MLRGSKAAYNRQATAFETVGDIYAPYYRQADATYSLSLPLEDQQELVAGIPKEDVFAAFDYYIK
jgi:L-amino acid N-acyltransferase YncA